MENVPEKGKVRGVVVCYNWNNERVTHENV
jgi:hypothetical protein